MQKKKKKKKTKTPHRLTHCTCTKLHFSFTKHFPIKCLLLSNLSSFLIPLIALERYSLSCVCVTVVSKILIQVVSLLPYLPFMP